MSTENTQSTLDGKFVRLPSGTRVRNLGTGKPMASEWTTDREYRGTARRSIVRTCEDPSLVWFRIYDDHGIESCGFAVLASDLEVIEKSDLVARIEAIGFENGSGETLSDCPEWRELVAQYRRFRGIVLG